MTLKGNLEVLNLGDIFQTLSLNKHTGTLRVDDGEREKMIYFSEGEICLLSSSKRVRLGERLVNAGLITEEELQSSLQRQKSSDKRLGEILVDEGFVGEDDIMNVVRNQIEEEIYDLFLWESAEFEFLVDFRPPELENPSPHLTKLRFNTAGLVMEAARRADEWKLIREEIPSFNAVFKIVREDPDAFDEIEVSESVKREVRWIDGEHSIESICEESGLSEFEVCQLIYEMKKRDLVEELAPQELAEKAEQFYDRNKFRQASQMYERLVEHLPTNSNLRWNLASCYKVLGEHDEAIEQYEAIAERAEKRSEFEELNRACSHILHLAPERKDIQAKLQRISRMTSRRKANRKMALVGVGLILLIGGLAGGLYMSGLLDQGNQSDAATQERRFQEYMAQKSQAIQQGDYETAQELTIKILEECPEASGWGSQELWLSVESTPTGLDLYVDGERKGVTPVERASFLPQAEDGDGLREEIEVELRWRDSDIVVASRTLPAIPEDDDRGPIYELDIEVLRQPAWRVDVGGEVIGPPVRFQDTVHVVSRDGHLYGLRLENRELDSEPVLLGIPPSGMQRSTFEDLLFGGVFSPPTLDGGVLYVGSSGGEVLAIRAETGQIIWRYAGDPGGAFAVEGAVRGQPGVDRERGVCVVGDEGGSIHFINIANGEPLREPIPTLNRIDAGVTVHEGWAYVGSLDNRLFAIELDDLASPRMWQRDLGGDVVVRPAAFRDRVFCAGGTKLHAFAATTGEELWTRQLEGPPVDALTVADEVLYAATDSGDTGHLHAFDADSPSGSPRWDDGPARVDQPATVRPVVQGGVVYTGDGMGRLYAVSRSAGEIVWRARVSTEERPSPVTCPPLALPDGRIVVGTGDGTISVVEKP